MPLTIDPARPALTKDFMLEIGALKGRIGDDKLVSNEYPPR